MKLHKGWTNRRIENTSRWYLIGMLESIDKRFLYPEWVRTLTDEEVRDITRRTRNGLMREYYKAR